MFFTSSNFSTNHSSSGLLSTHSDSESSLLSDNSGAVSSLLSTTSGTGIDVGSVGGKDILFGNPDMSNMSATFITEASQAETAGSIAFGQAETAGSIAFGSAETAGSVACGGGVSVGGGGDCGGGGFSSFC